MGLPDEVVRTHEVMIKHSHSQLWLSRERDAELQDPGQEGEWLSTPPCPRKLSYMDRSFRDLTSFCPFYHYEHISCLSMSQTTYGKVTPQNLGPSSLSKDGVQLLGDVALLGVLPLPASAHHHIGVCFAIGVRRSQVRSLGGQCRVKQNCHCHTQDLLNLISDQGETSHHKKLTRGCPRCLLFSFKLTVKYLRHINRYNKKYNE